MKKSEHGYLSIYQEMGCHLYMPLKKGRAKSPMGKKDDKVRGVYTVEKNLVVGKEKKNRFSESA